MLVLVGVLLVVIIALGLLWWQQENILFQPPGHVDIDDLSAKKVEFSATDGQQLFGYLVGASDFGEVLLAFHGNADLAIWQLEWASDVVHRFGIAVFLAEYRGYASISGKPTYASSELDADAAYKAIIEILGVSSQRIVIFGHSLGSAVAAELAARYPTRALILQSPFTSAREIARLSLARPLTLLWKLVSRIHFDTIAAVRVIDSRVSVIHGTRDLVVPARMGKMVYDAAKNRGCFAVVDKAGHNNIVEVAGEKYWSWLASALELPDATASAVH